MFALGLKLHWVGVFIKCLHDGEMGLRCEEANSSLYHYVVVLCVCVMSTLMLRFTAVRICQDLP